MNRIIFGSIFIFMFSSVFSYGVRIANESVTLNGYWAAHGGTPSYHYDYQHNDKMRDKYKGRIYRPQRRAFSYGVHHQHYPYLSFVTKAPYHNQFNHENAEEVIDQ